MATSTDPLRTLTRLTVRERYADAIAIGRSMIGELGIEELLLLERACEQVGDGEAMREVADRLGVLCGPDAQEARLARLNYAATVGDTIAARALLDDTELDSQLHDRLLRRLAGTFLRQHDWDGLLKIYEACLATSGEEGVTSLLLRLRAVHYLRFRDYKQAYKSANLARERASSGERYDAIVLEARCFEAAGMSRLAARGFEQVLTGRREEARLCLRGARAAVRAGVVGRAKRLLTLAEEAGAVGSGLRKVQAQLLLRSGQAQQALPLFQELGSAFPQDATLASGWAAAEAQCHGPQAMLETVDRRLTYVQSPALYARRVEALRLLGRQQEAEQTLAEARQRYPEDSELRQLEEQPVLLKGINTSGKIRPPQFEPNVVTVLSDHAVDFPAAEIDAVPVSRDSGESVFRPQWRPEDLRHPRGLRRALAVQLRVLYMLIMRETQTRFARTKLGVLWMFVEPLIHIGVFYILWSYRDKNTLGDMSLIMFLVTGFIPYFTFTHTYNAVVGSLRGGNRALLSHRHLGTTDIVLSGAIVEGLKLVIVFAVLLSILMLIGREVHIYDPLQVIACFFVFWLIGIGLGMVIEALSSIVFSLTIVMRFLMRFLYFTSGVIFPVTMLPYDLVQILLWNPMLHLVSLVRASFTLVDPMEGVSFNYPIQFAIILLAFGLLTFRALQRRMLAQ